jgi:RHS repeat-associated protein
VARAAGQTFSYDQYDNLTKTKIPADNIGSTFNPTYNSSNNHFQSGYGASYDSNGNQLYDPSNMNTYTWNEFGKLASVDMSGTGCSTSGECVIYDAFGRIVEVDSASTYTETWYTQAGKAIMNGAGKHTALWPAPGAGIVGDSGVFMHQDWLGNVRLGHNISAESVTFDQALTPYGEIYATSGTASYGENNFTGDVQAIVSGTSGLWDTPNRELGTAPSRWLSPDPAQSGWNPYAYGTNPNSMIDPSGLVVCKIDPPAGSCNGGGDPTGGPTDDSQIIGGFDIFDAIEGAAGTYLYTNMYGQTSFSFSQDLWVAAENFIDEHNASLEAQAGNLAAGANGVLQWDPNPVLTVYVQNLGVFTITSGLIPDYLQQNADTQWILSRMTGKELSYFYSNQIAPSIATPSGPRSWLFSYLTALHNEILDDSDEFNLIYGVTQTSP